MSGAGQVPVLRLGPESAPGIVGVLCEAFADYPVMRYVLGDGADYGRRLTRLISLFVMARVMRDEPLFGIAEATDLVAAAIVSYPGIGEAPTDFSRLRAGVFAELGADVQARYEAFGAATQQFEITEPHIHLNMIGVRRGHQGMGLGRRLIDRVQRLSREDTRSTGVTLTTEDPANVPFYERLGFERIGYSEVAPDLATWGFFRRD